MIVKLLLSGCHGVLNGCQGVSRLQCSGQLPRCRYVVAMLIVLDYQNLARVFSVFPRALIWGCYLFREVAKMMLG